MPNFGIATSLEIFSFRDTDLVSGFVFTQEKLKFPFEKLKISLFKKSNSLWNCWLARITWEISKENVLCFAYHFGNLYNYSIFTSLPNRKISSLVVAFLDFSKNPSYLLKLHKKS